MSEGEPGDSRRAGGPARRKRVVLSLASALSIALSACASIDQPSAPVAVAPVAAPRTTGGAPASPERKRLMEAFGGVYYAPATEAFLNGVLVKLAPAPVSSGQPYRVTLLNSPVVNAFALPSGDIFITRGLVALADDTSEIAAVMAHEIAHVTARHAAQRAEFEKTAALFMRVNSQVLEQARAPDEVAARSKLSIARFSRQQEFEADKIGIKTIGDAGYDPYGAARFLTALGEWSALSASITGAKSADRPDMMATHPSTPERVAQAAAEARQFGSPGVGETGRNAYLAAIDGLLFGDDPSQGVVRGTSFIHPKLGFAFEAPEGFTLENQSAALIGVGEAGGEALRLDSIPIAEFHHRRQRDRLGLDRRSQDNLGRDDADRRPRRGDRGRARRKVELPSRRGAPEWAALSTDFRRAHALSRRRRPVSRLARVVSLDERAGFGACRCAENQDRRGVERRYAGVDGRADVLPAEFARSIPDLERPGAGRAFGRGSALQDHCGMTSEAAPAGARPALSGRIVVATHNAGKLGEMRALLSRHGIDAVGAAELHLIEPEETGLTFQDNAALKARSAARVAGVAALADNSGLCVDALGGAPGIYSARWGGETRDFAAAMARVERELRAIGAPEPRRAHFISVLALAWPDGRVETFEGRVDGDLAFPPRGTAGFGYDPIFRPDGHARTFGEMSAEEKRGLPADGSLALSHRARAFQKLAPRDM